MLTKVNVAAKLALFSEYFSPKVVGDLEVHILLFEPATTLNTGNVVDARTKRELERI